MKKYIALLSLLIVMAGGAHANDEDIQHALRKLGIPVFTIQDSPLPGIKMVETESGVVYVTEDGQYMLQGPLYGMGGKQPANVTNQQLLKNIDALASEMIVYPAAKEQYVITVFTDTTCGYCRKLHSQIAEYNAQGITVRYLAFPRAGQYSQTEYEMKSVWCNADRNHALDTAMKGEKIAPAECAIKISEHYKQGVMFGIQGTPAILLDDGMMIPGYQDPKEMKALLDSRKQGK